MFDLGTFDQLTFDSGPVAPAPTSAFVGPFSQFSAPAKTILTAAVIATSFVGFVAPPSAKAAIPFSRFSEPPARANPQRSGWLSTPFVAPVAPLVFVGSFARFDENLPARSTAAQRAAWLNTPVSPSRNIAVFSQFSAPQISRAISALEQPGTTFEIAPPGTAPFTGFISFDAPKSRRPLDADQPTTAPFVVTPPVAITSFFGFSQFDYRRAQAIQSADQPTSVPVVSLSSFALSGLTIDSSGAPIPGCTVHLFRTSDNAFIAQTVSDASGHYSFSALADNTTDYFVNAYLVGATDRFGTTSNKLTPQ